MSVQKLHAILSQLRNAFAVERLPEPPQSPTAPRRPGLARTLFAREPFPSDLPTRPRSRRSLGLFTIEPLETLPPGAVHERRRRVDWPKSLFGVERLEVLPPAPAHARSPRGRWLRWLLGVERLDPSQE